MRGNSWFSTHDSFSPQIQRVPMNWITLARDEQRHTLVTVDAGGRQIPGRNLRYESPNVRMKMCPSYGQEELPFAHTVIQAGGEVYGC